MSGFHSTATRTAVGTMSLSSSRRLALNSGYMVLIPVMFPPGRARLSTSPLPTGSAATASTIGRVLVARLAAKPARVLSTTSTSTWRRSNSATRSARCSYFACAQRYSRRMFCVSR